MALSSNFTRPSNTTQYASGDLVANSTTAGSVTPLSYTIGGKQEGYVKRAKVKKSDTSTTNASFRLHLYDASPTCSNGDNGAWLTTNSSYLGSIDITVDKAFADAAQGEGVPAVGSEVAIPNGTDQIIYGLLEARAAYTPASAEVFTVILELYN